jgi:glycosyltransferase involved in cell wall biosynthesis
MTAAGGRPRRVVLVLPTLSGGGAERVMLRLLAGLPREEFAPLLVVGDDRGELAELVPADVPRRVLGRTRTRNATVRLALELRRLQPDVVLATLGLANAVLAAAWVLPRSTRIVVRLGSSLTAEGDTSRSRPREWLIRRAMRCLYRRADRIVCQSDYMLEDAAGYLALPRDRFTRIYNPLDSQAIHDATLIASRQSPRPPGPHLVSVGACTPSRVWTSLSRPSRTSWRSLRKRPSPSSGKVRSASPWNRSSMTSGSRSRSPCPAGSRTPTSRSLGRISSSCPPATKGSATPWSRRSLWRSRSSSRLSEREPRGGPRRGERVVRTPG